MKLHRRISTMTSFERRDMLIGIPPTQCAECGEYTIMISISFFDCPLHLECVRKWWDDMSKPTNSLIADEKELL